MTLTFFFDDFFGSASAPTWLRPCLTMRRCCCLIALLLCSLSTIHSYVPTRTCGYRLAFTRGFPSGSERSCRRRLFVATQSTDVLEQQEESLRLVDDRPHEQRATQPRTVRRLNHSFRYLYRHDDDCHNHTQVAHLTPLEFLVKHGGYTETQVLEMNETFPPLLDLDVQRHLWPKLRFLQDTIGVQEQEHDVLNAVPTQYFGARLERTIAPRHAFLIHHQLPHGRKLLERSSDQTTMLQDFLVSCRQPKHFCALCNSWKRDEQSQITAKQIEAFDVLFQRGLMAAARNELCQHNNTWPLQHVNITSAEITCLLLQHGANPMELDARGVSLLHWAAGCGNLHVVKVLLPYFPQGAFTKAERDGATPFHWAAAGAKAREFGCGGHIDVCRYLMEQLDHKQVKQLINTVTKDGNSILMWASWSGTLDVVKLLVRNRADALLSNRNGCTVAHWAASGGNLQVCQYLAETVGVDFTEPNYGGNTPLAHAVAFGRTDVVEWLRNDIGADENDAMAA